MYNRIDALRTRNDTLHTEAPTWEQHHFTTTHAFSGAGYEGEFWHAHGHASWRLRFRAWGAERVHQKFGCGTGRGLQVKRCATPVWTRSGYWVGSAGHGQCQGTGGGCSDGHWCMGLELMVRLSKGICYFGECARHGFRAGDGQGR